jgi:hypothetical protein
MTKTLVHSSFPFSESLVRVEYDPIHIIYVHRTSQFRWLMPARMPSLSQPSKVFHPAYLFIVCPYSYKYTRQEVRQENAPNADLSPRRRLVHHLRLLFLEPLPDALTAGHELADASRDAAGLAGDQRFGGEVIDAGLEAMVDEVREHLRRWRVSKVLKASKT